MSFKFKQSRKHKCNHKFFHCQSSCIPSGQRIVFRGARFSYFEIKHFFCPHKSTSYIVLIKRDVTFEYQITVIIICTAVFQWNTRILVFISFLLIFTQIYFIWINNFTVIYIYIAKVLLNKENKFLSLFNSSRCSHRITTNEENWAWWRNCLLHSTTIN